jgi:hypothetical protein
VGWNHDPIHWLWRLFGDGSGDVTISDAVPVCGCFEGSGSGIPIDERFEFGAVDGEFGAGQVLPEVPEIRVDVVALPVEERHAERRSVKVHVPQFGHYLFLEHARSRSGQWRREREPAHRGWVFSGQGLGDIATRVVARDHGVLQAELVDQPRDTARLGRWTVIDVGVQQVPIGFTEAAQIGSDYSETVS